MLLLFFLFFLIHSAFSFHLCLVTLLLCICGLRRIRNFKFRNIQFFYLFYLFKFYKPRAEVIAFEENFHSFLNSNKFSEHNQS